MADGHHRHGQRQSGLPSPPFVRMDPPQDEDDEETKESDPPAPGSFLDLSRGASTTKFRSKSSQLGKRASGSQSPKSNKKRAPDGVQELQSEWVGSTSPCRPEEVPLPLSPAQARASLADYPVVWKDLRRDVKLLMEARLEYPAALALAGEDKCLHASFPLDDLAIMILSMMHWHRLDSAPWTKYVPRGYFTVASVPCSGRCPPDWDPHSGVASHPGPSLDDGEIDLLESEDEAEDKAEKDEDYNPHQDQDDGVDDEDEIPDEFRPCPQARRSRAAAATQEPGKCRTPVGAGRPTGEHRSLHDGRVGGARHGGLAPERLGTLESRKSSDRLLVVHGRVWGYGYPFRILIDSGASKNFARRRSVARNADKFADALRENLGAGPVSVRLANGSLVEVPRVLMDLSVKFEDFDSTERFIVLEMDKYDLILGMPWLEKHGPWIDWRDKAIGASRPALSDRALVSHVPTSSKSKGVRQDRQGASASEEFMGVAEVFGVPQEVTVGSVVGNVVPRGVRKALIAWKARDTASNMSNLVPREPVKANQEGKVGEAASCVGNIVPHKASMAYDALDEASSDVGNIVPRRGRRRRRRHRKSGLRSQTGVAQGDSEPKAPQTRSSDGHDHVLDSETGLRVKADAVQLEALPEELNSSSVMDEDVLEAFRKQRASRLRSAIFKNPKDPVYPLMKEFEDVVSKDPPSQLPPDRGIRHKIDLVPGTKYCVTRQWPLPREQCEVIDAFFAAKAKAGMVRELKSQHSSPTFCVRKPNGKWRLVHAYNKVNSATVPAQTPIPRKDVLLNNIAGCTLYSALDLVDGYYQLLMRESDIPLTAVSTPSGMLWEWLVIPQGLSNAPATFNRLVTQLFRPLRAFAQTYFDAILVYSRAENGQTAMEVHLGHPRRVFDVMRANKLYANIDKCVFGAEEIKVLGCFVSSAGVRADPEKVKVIAAWPTPRSQKDLRKWLGLANYLHKYSAGYTGLAKPLSDLLKKDTDWRWERQHQEAFDNIKASLQRAPILALPDESKPFSVVCDASDYAIGCALLQPE
ncbi:unnamed protein product [Phytophthora fragariaefolia]|uniref:Unnamed protein product n=1 Tax=Phytophthora fragariaefolia TaxID=1490495 RepID=A0A9W6XS69_9STRA|nr:unnamed protein product [Phytophthora fragariaefolia]